MQRLFLHWDARCSACPTLCHPMDYGPSSSSASGISQARILEWVAISFSRGSFWPGIELASPALPVDALLRTCAFLVWIINRAQIWKPVWHTSKPCSPTSSLMVIKLTFWFRKKNTLLPGCCKDIFTLFCFNTCKKLDFKIGPLVHLEFTFVFGIR